MAAGWGQGLTEGMRAGSEMAGRWIDAYNTSKKQYEYSQAAQAGGNDPTQVGVDYLKSQFGLDDDAANTMLQQIRADPSKAAQLLNTTNAVTGGAAGNAAPAQAAAAAGGTAPSPLMPPTQPSPPGTSGPDVQAGAVPVQGVTTTPIPPGPAPTGAPPAPVAPTAPTAPAGPAMGAPPLLDAQGGVAQPAVPPAALAPPSAAVPPAAADVGGMAAGSSASGGPTIPPGTTANPMLPPAAAPAAPVAAPVAAPATGLTPPAGSAAAGASPQTQFVQQYGPQIMQAAQALGVAPEIIAGHIGEETGWGQKVIPGTNNLGNIKAGSDWQGDTVRAKDTAEGSNDPYRKYRSPDESIDDYVKLIQTKYPGAVGAGSDAAKFFGALKQGGYATDPDYVKKGVAATMSVGGRGLGTTPAENADITKPPTQQALQTQPQVAADNLSKLTQLSTRMFVDPRTKFNVDAQGNVSMQGPASDSDRFLNMARVALKWGDASTAKQAMDAHFEAKAEEANTYVKNVLSSDMNDDQKVAALAHGTGIQIYKADNGQYIVPALSGGPDQNGQYKRLSMTDIGNLSQSLTTQEGIKNLYAYQQKNQELSQAQYKEQIEAPLRQAQTDYYSGRTGAMLEKQRMADEARIAAANAAQAARANAAALKAAPGPEVLPVTGSTVGAVNNVQVQNPDGSVASHTVQDIPGDLNTSGQGGKVLDSEATTARVNDIKKQLASSDYAVGGRMGAQPGEPSISATVPEPINTVAANGKQYQTKVGSPVAGRFMFQASAMNPATGRVEPFEMTQDGPKFGTMQDGKLHYANYATANEADAQAQKYHEWKEKQRGAAHQHVAEPNAPTGSAAQYGLTVPMGLQGAGMGGGYIPPGG